MLNKFLTFWTESQPQKTHALRQWDHIYVKWSAEYCSRRLQQFERITGRRLSELDSVALCNYERYTCCINVPVSQNRLVHVCDFLPIVLGTKLDRSIRREFWLGSSTLGDNLKIGMFVLNRNYFHFSACLNTNPRVCHVYRPSSKFSDVEVRSYFYDHSFRGYKLYYRESNNGMSRLTLRNCFTQEYDLMRRSCKECANQYCDCSLDFYRTLSDAEFLNGEIVDDFVASCLSDVGPYILDFGTKEFVLGTYLYMRETRILDHDIDLLRNKCVFNGPHLYGLLMNQFSRSLQRFSSYELSGVDVQAYVQRNRVLSHTANLYMFVSRKTNLRVDVTGGMKRSLKTEVRREKHDQQRDVVSARHASSVVVPSNTVSPVSIANTNSTFNDALRANEESSASTAAKCSRDVCSFFNNRTYYVACPVSSFNVSQMLIYGKSPFLYNVSAFHFTDLEYVFEQVKRLRVENLNAVKCLLMPREFECFLSHYNIGNISSAGRSMNLCVRARTSFFCHDSRTVVRSYIDWLRCVLQRCSYSFDNFRVVCNEIYVNGLFIPRCVEEQFFVLSKLTWPGVQVFRKTAFSNVIVVSINSGVPFIPYLIRDVDGYCDVCHIYDAARYSSCKFLLHSDTSFINAFFPNSLSENQNVCRGGLTDESIMTKCSRHVWISPAEKQYLRMLRVNSTATSPFWHEIACHGLLRVSCFSSTVDISKIIVSINAERRKIRFEGFVESSSLEMLMDQNVRVVVRDTLLPLSRLPSKIYPLASPGTNSFKCFFMFGDFGGRNCEDAYVFDSAFVPFSDTVCQFKINVYRHDRSVVRSGTIRYVDNVALNVRCGGAGCVVRLGYVVATERLRFGSSVICTYEQKCAANRYLYTLFYMNNASYLDESYASMRFTGKPTVLKDLFDVIEYGGKFCGSDNVVLYESSRVSDCERVSVSVTVTSRQLRFSLSLRENRQIYKFQNRCGQKGMPVYSDLSHLRSESGNRIHMIVSMYSVLGRTPVSQWLEQRGNVNGVEGVRDLRSGKLVGYGGFGLFFFSCDSPHDNFLMSSRIFGTNPVRFCNLTYHALTESGLSTTTFLTASDHENGRNSPYSFVSEDVQRILTVYRYYNRAFDFKRLRLAERRRVARTAVMLASRNIRSTFTYFDDAKGTEVKRGNIADDSKVLFSNTPTQHEMDVLFK